MGKYIDMTGKRFGKLIVESRAEDHYRENGRKDIMWNCICDCGNHKIINGTSLRLGYTQSCGCFQKERASDSNAKHNDTDSRLYGVWCAIKRRCTKEYDPHYHIYGGRGITMCEEWLNDYATFMDWSYSHGYDKDAKRGECTIDRIDNNAGYNPDNCRWVSQGVQMNNVSYNHVEEYNGESHTIAEWSRITGIPYHTFMNGLHKYGKTFKEIISSKQRNNL